MIIRYLDYSGAPKVLLWLAKMLAERGHKVTLCTFKTKKGRVVPKGVEWIDLTDEHLGFFGLILRLRGLIRKGCYDISLSFLLDANVYNMFACCGLRTKSIVCERNDPFKPRYYKLKFWKPWFRLADGAVFQLPKVAEYYSNIKVPTAVIPNPIIDEEDTVCLPRQERKKRIVTHGRLDNEQKRHDVLIMAFAMFHQDYPDYTLSIYGSDSNIKACNEKALRALIAKLGLGGCIILEGETKEPKKVMQDAMLWMLTSDYEGIPNSLIEAMSMGLPCISTDCSPGGARFLIKNGVNGYLVERGSVRGLYEKMKYMIEHPLEAENMGHEAIKIKQSLMPEDIVDKWEKYLINIQ